MGTSKIRTLVKRLRADIVLPKQDSDCLGMSEGRSREAFSYNWSRRSISTVDYLFTSHYVLSIRGPRRFGPVDEGAGAWPT